MISPITTAQPHAWPDRNRLARHYGIQNGRKTNRVMAVPNLSIFRIISLTQIRAYGYCASNVLLWSITRCSAALSAFVMLIGS